MVGITDIPDWCFFEAYGDRTRYTEAPSPEDMSRFHQMSPISHISKVKTTPLPFFFDKFEDIHLMILLVQVKTPTLFLLGTMDLRVPISNGIQVRSICNSFNFADPKHYW